ncbi:MAG: poly(R)-hydroxyalkanoic acid synthase subunit PhaE [Thermodesulfobacteriota bacterium]
MTESKRQQTESQAETMAATFMKSVTDLWEKFPQILLDMAQKNEAGSKIDAEGPGQNYKASMDAVVKNWQAVSAAMTAPESVHSILKSAGAMPDILFKLAQSTLGGLVHIQQKWMEQATRVTETAEAYKFENLDENIHRAWTEMYEKEFRQFLNIPKIGLTRSYQEKLNAALDKYNIYQASISEFIRLLSLPVSRSTTVMQEKMSSMVESGKLPEESQQYYQMWIKILEGHYMTLFQSSEYVQTLGKTMDAISEFTAAKDAVLEDFLGSLPIPNRKEIDGLEREIYELKKRLRMLEKKQS